MGTFDGIPILGDVEKAWNDNVAKPINDTVVKPIEDSFNSTIAKDVNQAISKVDKGGGFLNFFNKTQKAELDYLNFLKTGVQDSFKPIWERESTVKVLGKDGAEMFKRSVENIPNTIEDAINQGLKESTEPIWERDSTVELLGEDGADKLQDVFNPARWGENAINDLGVSDNTKDALKKYLPVALAGGAALLLITALK